MAENSSIVVCDQRFDVGRRVITWQEDASISAYTPHCVSVPGRVGPTHPAKGIGEGMAMRYRARRSLGADRSLSRLQQVVKQFVVHHDGMNSSRDCFRVLHDERGLSVHFLIDNNGDIYQTLDLVECGFQAAGVNEISIGVELCNRGDALTYPDFYDKPIYKPFPRDKVTCTINGHQWLAFSYTKEQKESMTALGRALARILPGLPQTCPSDGSGEPLWATLAGDPRDFAGYLGHYHVTNQKWDPGPYDFKQFIQSIRGRVFYPALPGRDKTEIPEEPGKPEELATELYDNNEKEGEGGYYPVGPIGQSRLWHGGLHLRDDKERPVVAPFAGKIVAARQKKEDEWPEVGSPNFVLLKHDMAVNGAQVKFWTLMFHTMDESQWEADKRPVFMQKKWSELESGDVVSMEEAVGAGELIGHFGEAGRPGNRKGQVHWEIFSDEEIGEKIDPGFWKTIDGMRVPDKKAGPRFCQAPEIVVPIDANKNGMLAGSEILNFFHNNPAREQFHKIAAHHPSEWGDSNDYEVALNNAPDFRGLPRPVRHKLFQDQIQSMLWWDDKLDTAGLPEDKIVWTYQPITFVFWINSKLKGAPQKAKGVESESAFAGKKPPSEIKDDTSDDAGGFTDDEDALFGEASKNLDLEKLANGFPAETSK